MANRQSGGKPVLILNNEAVEMNRNEAIVWCRKRGFRANWPNSTKHIAPEGWRWVVGCYPYQSAVYKLVNANHDEIFKVDL